MFTTRLVKQRNLFTAAVIIMGGLGKYSKEVDQRPASYPIPLLIITGKNDTYRESTENVRDYLLREGYPVEFLLIPERGHKYSHDHEEFIEKWLNKHK